MINIKDTNNRIVTINSIINITNAMKLVSVAELKKTQIIYKQFMKYYLNIKKIFFILNNKKKIRYNNFCNKNILLIFISSNKGLCGSFNSLLFKKLDDYFCNNIDKNNVSLLTIGNKGYIRLSKKYKIYKNFNYISNNINFKYFSKYFNTIINDYIVGNFSNIKIIFTNFVNSIKQYTIIKDILPIINNKTDYMDKYQNDYILESSKKKLYDYIFPLYLKCRLYSFVLSSLLSENSFRMLSMYKAHENSCNIKNSLMNTYNKLRQNAITSELCEVINGFKFLDYK